MCGRLSDLAEGDGIAVVLTGVAFSPKGTAVVDVAMRGGSVAGRESLAIYLRTSVVQNPNAVFALFRQDLSIIEIESAWIGEPASHVSVSGLPDFELMCKYNKIFVFRLYIKTKEIDNVSFVAKLRKSAALAEVFGVVTNDWVQ